MASLFSALQGFNIFENASILSGSGAPGGDTAEQDDAPIGSLYLRTDAETDLLQIYSKIDNQNSTNDWDQLATKSYVETFFTETGVTTETTIDEVLVDDYNAVQWWVTVIDEVGDGSDKLAFAVYGVHDGTPSADATEANHTNFQYITTGTGIDDVAAIVDVDGTGATQTMRLRVSCTTAVTVNATRKVIL